MIERLAALEEEYQDLEARLSDAAVVSDPDQLRTVSQRYKELGPVVETVRAWRTCTADIAAAEELMAEEVALGAVEADVGSLRTDLAQAVALRERLEDELRALLAPRDPNDGKAVIMEIRGAEGGEEANLFARDLYEMYRAYTAAKGFAVEVLSIDPSDLGGLNQVTFVVRGAEAWSCLKYEGGPHRVQRVPVTESQGRVHTSSATVTVMPEVAELDVQIDERDLDIDVYRASGPGGQGVNTTDSAVRITHRPTGVVVAMQDQRSQLQNKARAMLVLRARVAQAAQAAKDADESAQRRAQTGGGGRSEKIRTYNVKENRLTDHRIGFTIYRLADVLAGALDDVVAALQADERTRQLTGTDV